MSIVASASTRSHFQNKAKEGKIFQDDPWQNGNDPWNKYKPLAATSSEAPTDKIRQMEDRIKENLRASVRKELEDHSMNVDYSAATDETHIKELEQRMLAMEADVHELKGHSETFQEWFQQSAEADKMIQSQVNEMQATVEAQKTGLDELRQEVKSNSTSIAAELNNIRTDVRDELQQGMSRLAEMLGADKRHKAS